MFAPSQKIVRKNNIKIQRYPLIMVCAVVHKCAKNGRWNY